MGEFRGQLPLGDYNAAVRPEQDRLYVPDLIICPWFMGERKCEADVCVVTGIRFMIARSC